MVLIRAIIRCEKVGVVLDELEKVGFPAVTKMDVFGRGKQKGIKVGEVVYDEIPKEMLLIVVEDEEKDTVIKTIMKYAQTGVEGNFGDGRIFVAPVEEAYTVSTQEPGL